MPSSLYIIPNVWIQILANIFNISITKSKTENATLIGESMLAFSNLGIYSNIEEAGNAMIRMGETFEPDIYSVDLYKKYYDFFVKMVEKYKEVYNDYIKLYKD